MYFQNRMKKEILEDLFFQEKLSIENIVKA